MNALTPIEQNALRNFLDRTAAEAERWADKMDPDRAPSGVPEVVDELDKLRRQASRTLEVLT